MIKHFLLTRFNVKMLDKFRNDRNGTSTHTEEWLLRRFELFERYCLPSVNNQPIKTLHGLSYLTIPA